MGVFDDLKGSARAGAGVSSNIEKTEKPLANRLDKQAKKARAAACASVRADMLAIYKSDNDVSGVPVSLLPVSVDDVTRLLPSWVDRWTAAAGVSDLRKITSLQFNALCIDIGRSYIKPSGIIKDTTRKAAGACVASTCGRYNPRAVLALYDVFRRFCLECNKIPMQVFFADFCGITVDYVREYIDRLTSAGVDLAKITHDAELQAVRLRVSDDTIGRLAILNNELYGVAAASDSGAIPAAASLPVFGSS